MGEEENIHRRGRCDGRPTDSGRVFRDGEAPWSSRKGGAQCHGMSDNLIVVTHSINRDRRHGALGCV